MVPSAGGVRGRQDVGAMFESRSIQRPACPAARAAEVSRCSTASGGRSPTKRDGAPSRVVPKIWRWRTCVTIRCFRARVIAT